MRNRIEVPAWRYRQAVEMAREFRKEPTRSEALMWEALRGRKLAGYKFRRQQNIGPFIVDFYCPERRLIVEIDGGVHEQTKTRDAGRQRFLEGLGTSVVRVAAEEVERDLQTVVRTIRAALELAQPT